LNDDSFDLYLQQGWHRLRPSRKLNQRTRGRTDESSFRCLNCHYHVVTDPVFSGVGNRNHCPYCLWSRHMDLYKPGDRLAVCKMPMRPIGLTLKKSLKRYTASGQGELMLIHRCAECGKISINRIAADDDPDRLLDAFKAGIELDASTRTALEKEEIQILQAAETQLVRARLYGWELTSA
jgi:hypothetical protein